MITLSFDDTDPATEFEAEAFRKSRLCDQADKIIGDAMRLRVALRTAAHLPLPDDETDELMAAISKFVRAAEKVQR